MFYKSQKWLPEMGCNDKRTDCSIETAFAGIGNIVCGQIFDPSKFQYEQVLYDSAYRDLINNFGITINYYVRRSLGVDTG